MKKIKQWAKDNKKDLALGATVGTILGICTGLILNEASKIKQAKANGAEAEAFFYKLFDLIEEQEKLNRYVYPLDDGRFLTVDKKANQETVSI